ncbi:MAG: hypothetical protein WBX14_07550 [Candidatus Udaeobacter sp.]
MQPKIGARCAMNGSLDARSNLCYTQINVEQDYSFDRNGGRAFHESASSQCAIVHLLQRAGAKGLSPEVLR